MIRDTSGQDRVIARTPWWRRHRKWLLIGGIAALVLALIVPVTLRSLSAGTSVSRQRISIATVERGDFTRDISAEGRVVAAVSPTLYAPAPGSVRFSVQAGGKVDKDQVIGSVDSPELTSKLAQERANLEALQVDYSRAQLDARQQALVAEQTLEQAQIDRQTAVTEQERTKKAFELGVTPEIEVLRTQAALQKAEIALKRADTDHELQKEGRRFDVEARRLARDRQQLMVDDLQRQVDLLTLRSPVSGQVGQLMVTDRSTVAKDAALLTVVDLSALEVEVKVPESFARDLAVGMPATIRGNGSEWRGEVSAVAPEVVNGEVTARVRFVGEAPQGLRQSQRLSVRVVLDERKNVVMVARGPFLDLGRGTTAYVVDGDIAEKRAIRTGAASVDKVEILDGLQPGDQIVISGTDTFNDADRVALSR
ncbi:efflux RND transporter periplasmic adaptor subunit [Solimonas terrae]|uniref:Efflux RND transporter periplasmic adaptor subunit n=1 Tax=Solimonas terrae TaxID=1396819 RepID=A0A6M2BPA6_9GAMM|nr:efflux RND transporter periplasmic adaptor subunit [Solimonas terrae]